ncbi:hypothetical protein Glove_296g11 [Diversispora epigaea]|uniref:Uncharacterized protein n=1 Tax=Diversispora epigaea TaxID=1348612 RepID=A0A397HY69_9GLOM|nr:hypothetical protein Glove_296g11 [Diversispora epigaea]
MSKNFKLNTSTEESNNDISDTVSSINEMSLDSDDFSQIEELQSIREENLPPVSEISYQYESDSNYAGDVSLRSEEFENFDEILSESLQNYTEKSDTNMSNTLEEFEPKSLTLQDNIEESEVEIKEFPNEAYADLMTLVTKHNLNTVSSINEMSLDSDDFSQIEELQSIREENLPPVSEISYQYESDSNYAGDVSLRSEEFENFDEILSESLQNYTEKSDTNMSNTLEEFEPKSLTLQDNIEESEVEIKEFPNEAYADLMTLVTKHNLNNKAGNSIIKFFNRHSDLSQSPLPKNIETGRKFMDKMNISQLSYSKHCILVHNNREYFINYRPIKNCIEILLSNSEILQHFIFKYENKKHQGEKSYAEQNSGNWWKYAEASIPSSACILFLILYSDATTTDTLGKSSLHPIYISSGNFSGRKFTENLRDLQKFTPKKINFFDFDHYL